MKLNVIRNKKSEIISTIVFVLVMLVPIVLNIFIQETFLYPFLTLKVLGLVVLGASLFYTSYVFTKQIKTNMMFGVTRKETYKKWKLKIILIGLYVILVNIGFGVYEAIETNGFVFIVPYELAIYMTGFNTYFLLNYLLYVTLLGKKDENKKKKIALAIMIIGLLLSVCFSFLLYLIALGNTVILDVVILLELIDVVGGWLVLFIGLGFLIFDKKSLYEGEY